ncbi:MAG: hypothetical protein F4138_03860 [Acidimicrobiia bacterium]|nr:hypothetical protein [Acidimicrobiia bacterium]MYC58244.1 hypothetical protein [Acidimicrobiia bacterium]MYG94113.1 hypothetical protein [Acidimicrobiia bacterium]MYI30114.1 hypothetical protein [Acidimicrobiia bacterium]
MTGTHLTGLEGTNPLGFFAALGVQVAFEGSSKVPRLWWSDDVVPHAVVDDSCSLDDITERAMELFPVWLESPAITTGLEPSGDVKFKEKDIVTYLSKSRGGASGIYLAASLIAEGSLDNSGVAKPTDLYFTAGQQKFLKIVTEVLAGVTNEDLIIGLAGPWSYQSKLGSLMWDVTDDSNYALSASDPSKCKKLTNPGVEALAILGISRYPVFGSSGRTLTLGASGSWKRGSFVWPLWTKPGSHRVVPSLLAHVPSEQTDLFWAWGIKRVMRSVIRRSDQGGYGTFGPPEVLWSRE